MSVEIPDGRRPDALAPEQTSHSITSALRRVADVVVAALTLVLTLPLLLGAAVAIRLHSAGPVISRCVRIGRDGVPFEMYRLRSTVDETGQMTRLCRVLRWSSIDDLPQLWNVLRGDMSLVGPRPARLDETAARSTPGDGRRLRRVPGLTGTWSEAEDPATGRNFEPRSGLAESPEYDEPDYRAG